MNAPTRIGSVHHGKPISYLGLNIKRLQREKLLKLEHLAEDVGVSVNTLTQAFRPNSGVRLNVVYRVAQVLGVEVWELFVPAEIPPPNGRYRPPKGPRRVWNNPEAKEARRLAGEGLSSAEAARAMTEKFGRQFNREMLLSHSSRNGYKFKGVKGRKRI